MWKSYCGSYHIHRKIHLVKAKEQGSAEISYLKIKNIYLHWGMLIVIFEKMKRGSRPEVFCEKGFRRNFTKFTGDSDTGVFLWILRNF